MHFTVRASVGLVMGVVATLAAERVASACTQDSDCTLTPATPVCSGGSCVACASDYTTATPPPPRMCPSFSEPACNTTGPLAGACTQCSADDSSLCTPENQPVCQASGFCGCADDTQCTQGKLCEINSIYPDGFCFPGCEVHNGNSNCPIGLVCSVTDGGRGVCEDDGGTGSSSGSGSSSGTGSSSGWGSGSGGDSGSSDATPGDGASGDGSGRDGSGNSGDASGSDGAGGDGKAVGDSGQGEGGQDEDGYMTGGGCDCSASVGTSSGAAGWMLVGLGKGGARVASTPQVVRGRHWTRSRTARRYTARRR